MKWMETIRKHGLQVEEISTTMCKVWDSEYPTVVEKVDGMYKVTESGAQPWYCNSIYEYLGY